MAYVAFCAAAYDLFFVYAICTYSVPVAVDVFLAFGYWIFGVLEVEFLQFLV